MHKRVFLACLALVASDETCPQGTDGEGVCQIHPTHESVGTSGAGVLPPCKESFELSRLASDSASWCDPGRVPVDKRAPKKVQGLFWLKGLPLDDVAACFSNGEWDQSTLTLKVTVWKDFMFMDTAVAAALVTVLYQSEMAYLIKFENENLTTANISPVGNTMWSLPASIFGAIATFPLVELPASTPGDKWSRPSYFGMGSASMLTNEYDCWRILDGDLKVNTENVAVMLRLLGPRVKGLKINRFHIATAGGQCSESIPAEAQLVVNKGSLMDRLKARVSDYLSISTSSSEVVPCSDGVLLVLTQQPTLGVRYLEVSGQATTFAVAEGTECTIEYSLLCVNEVVAVHAAPNGNCGSSATAGAGALRVVGWDTCATESGIEKLQVSQRLLHQTWDTEIEAKTLVTGCVGLRSAKSWPELRGNLTRQKTALTARKASVGGCPFYQDYGDRMARGQDFGSVFGIWIRGSQYENGVRADMWARGVGRWGKELGFVERGRDKAAAYVSLGFLGGASKQNRTVAFCTWAEANCGEPAPFADGPQVFRHADVLKAAADPTQIRTFSTATVEQTEACFDQSLPLFASSGSPEHTQVRQLLDEAGFDSLHEKTLPGVEGAVPTSIRAVLKSLLLGDSTPSETDVGHFVVSLVLEVIWEKKPSAELVSLVVSYLDHGKVCIFGKKAEELMILNGINKPKIQRIREAVAAFGRSSPLAEKVETLIDQPEYADVKAQYAARGKPPADVLVGNIGDVILFAGILGTTDMTTKCVQYTRRDRVHLRMFRKNRISYLHELMRYDSAVTSFTTALKKQETWKMEGRDVNFEPGTPIQMVLGSANRDEAVFANPSNFDPDRLDANESLSWNGRLGDVIARNYTGAPRFCPGYHVSVKIAAAVCEHLTKDLSEWGSGAKVSLDGTVKILAEGRYQNRVAHISYMTNKGQYCIVDKERGHAHLGCYSAADLEQLDHDGGFSRSLEDEQARCPQFAQSAARMFASSMTQNYMSGGGIGWLVEKAMQKHVGTEFMTPDWADSYVLPLYTSVVHVALKAYKARHADSVRIPIHTGKVEEFTVGSLSIAGIDIDHPRFLPVEAFIPADAMDAMLLPSFNCFQAVVRNAPMVDRMNLTDMNQWNLVLQGRQFQRKKDWVLSWFTPYKTLDGDHLWPEVEIDFSAQFLKQNNILKVDVWDDGLEKAIAFDLIGAHRVRAVQKEFAGETLPYVIRLNDFKDIPVRPHFGKFGCDMYFTESGIPAMIVSTDGREIGRGDTEWQYWKFAWRSSLITIITLVDHLHTTHFRGAETLAKATRTTLSPDHPLRRFLSIFTFGSIFVNLNAGHALVGPDHTLHRAGPFQEFNDLSAAVPTMVEEPFSMHAPLRDEEAFDNLPALVKTSPYFVDGKLLYGAIDRLVDNFGEIYLHEMCDENDHVVKTSELHAFTSLLVADYATSKYKNSLDHNITCSALKRRLTAVLWTVTGWHRHVGTVGDYYMDPDLAAMSWKEGEAHSRPYQHMIASVIVAFTATKQPKLIEDYTHVFKGMEKQQVAEKVWKTFQKDLVEVSETIDKRNSKRDIKNYHHDPRLVECSVAV